jgi:hypothetical protein
LVVEVPLEEIAPRLRNPRALGLERFSIRLREGSTTQSAWRLSVASEEGPGAIVFVETSPTETFYRGEGVFLGWPQDRMALAYRALLPDSQAERFEIPQLG